MKASELIVELEERIREHGDLECCQEFEYLDTIDQVRYENLGEWEAKRINQKDVFILEG